MELLLTSVVAFVSTNIDDLFILTLFFGGKEYQVSEIVAGQLIGISTLIAVSLLGSLVGLFIDPAYLGLLGLIPIYLGAKGIAALVKDKAEDEQATRQITSRKTNNIFAVSGVTIANGGDNIGIYIPLFASLTWSNKIAMTTVFLIMTLVWCLMAKYFTKHPLVARGVDKYGHLITPFVLMLLGCYIIYESGTMTLLWK